MAESPEELYARVVAAVGEDGRLPMPPVTEWDMFPWEVVDGELVPKVVLPPMEADHPRQGVDGDSCGLCTGEGDGVRIWESWNFHVMRPARPSGLPLKLWLNSNDHFDFTEMSDEQAAEFGQLSVWLARIMSRLPGIGRVHVNRWGDGSEHMHAWFVARPERMPGIVGSLAVEWDEMLPPGPEDVWLEDCNKVATKLAHHAGRALV
ncbi:hypothetical protein EXE58_10090 [Nocardioides seonyuensis]|uniref:Diadenosine tetraphosphate hydrolase n=1 Tax=Nocardioides seonyuensis TaxID=2518371 RepID=A0A4P7IIR4_9ACTN|nr:hypothetical protein [Nocardioides seonyuensis]QBX55771.1 hypothetical protein EXE58_10090 [Nocardioides seonyuensis]